MGGGLTATSMLCQFVDKAHERAAAGQLDPRAVEVAVFEKTDEFGPGFPHNDRYLMPFHITNMCAADMGVYADRPGDFQSWVNRNLDRLKDRFATFPAEVFEPAPSHNPFKHYPRAFMGDYLQTRFHQAVQAARRSEMTVRLHPRHEVTDVRQEGESVRIVANRSEPGGRLELMADAALLATGHWFSDSRRENYFDSPWPAQKLIEGIPPGADLAVIGTSLSAIETVLTLTSDGRFVGDTGGGFTYIPPQTPRRITLYSRRGLLPKVRGAVGSYRNKFLTPAALDTIRRQNDGHQSLEATFRLLNSELESAYGRPVDWAEVLEPGGCPADALSRNLREAEKGDGREGEVLWQTVLYQTFPFIREWYLGLTVPDRTRFDREFTSVFFTHAATQPRINAAKLLALLRTGLVRVVKLGRHYRFYRDDRRACYRFDYTDRRGQNRSTPHRYVVNARGQEKSLETDPSELARKLIASGGIRIEPANHRVVTPGSGAVYAVGAMTRGQIIDASMAHGISRSTATIADNILSMLAQWR